MESKKNKEEFRMEKVPSLDSDKFDIFLDALLAGYEGESDEPTHADVNSETQRIGCPEVDSVGVSGAENEEDIALVEPNANPGANDETDGQNRENANTGRRVSGRASQPDFVAVAIEQDDENIANLQEEAEDERDALLANLIYDSRPNYLTGNLEILTMLMVTPFRKNSSHVRAAVQWGFFLFGSIPSITLQAMFFKDYLLGVVKRGNMYHYISLCYTLNSIVLQISYMWIIISNKIEKMLENLDRLFEGIEKPTMSEPKRNKAGVMISLLSIMSAIALASGMDAFLIDFDPSNIVVSKSYRLSTALHAWSKKSYKADTTKLWNKAEKLEAKQFPLMCIQMVIEYAGFLNIYMIKDLMTTASLDIYQLSKTFKAYLEKIQSLDDTIMNSIWVNYEFLYKISEGYEKCFKALFIVNHVHNLLFCSYFLVDCLTMNTFFPGSFTVRLIIVIKIAIAYGGSVSAYGSGGKVQKKLHDLSASQVAPGRRGQRMREEISFWVEKVKYRPVGIGSGHFRVAGDFVFRFVGYVVSGFLCFLRAQEEELAQVVE